jgi:hypothetical protein
MAAAAGIVVVLDIVSDSVPMLYIFHCQRDEWPPLPEWCSVPIEARNVAGGRRLLLVVG